MKKEGDSFIFFTDNGVLARRIRAARERAGLLQQEVAEALGFSRPTISFIESGKRKVGAMELVRIAKLYKTTPVALLDGQDSSAERLGKAFSGLSAADQETTLRFIAFLKNQEAP